MMKAWSTQRGYLMIYAIILTFGFMSAGLAAIALVGSQYSTAKNNVYRQNASYASRACVAATLQELRDDPNFSGLTDEEVFDRTSSGQGKAVCTTVVTADGANTRIIEVTSSVLRTDSDTAPIMHKATAVAATGAAPAPEYSGVTIGHGGMELPLAGHFSAERVDVLGTLKVGSDNFSGYTGALVADEIRVANIGCGSSNWPQACPGQPITLYSLPFGLAPAGPVLGDVCAPGQVPNVALPDLDTGCTLPSMDMPAFDKKSFVESLDGPTIQASDIFDPDNYPNSCVERVPVYVSPPYGIYDVKGAKYEVPAGATIVGDIDINLLQSNWNDIAVGKCEIYFQGDAYIKGNIRTIASGTRRGKLHIGISDSMTGSDVTIVSNGQVILQDAAFPSNASDTKLHFVSFYSNVPSCSNSDVLPSATNPTCLTPQQAKDAVSFTYSAFFPTSAGVPNYRAFQLQPNDGGFQMDHVSIYAYYAGLGSSCNWGGNLSIGAVAAQVYGGTDCWGASAFTNMEVTDEESTFGAPPRTGEFGLVDYHPISLQ